MFSKIKEILRINNKPRFLIFLMLVIFCITFVPTYSYLKKTKTFSTGNNLNITNGNIQLDLSNDGTTAWTTVVANDSPAISGGNSITNPYSGQQITYGPVYLNSVYNSSSTNLTSNLDIEADYNLLKNGGTTEIVNSTEGSSLCEPFEVIVGDIDNFNLGFSSGYDCYSGTLDSQHSMDVYPKSYDAQGSDRRMVPSGFYNLGTKIFTQVDGASVYNGLKLPIVANATSASYSSGSYFGLTLTSATTYNSTTIPKNLISYYDGYTNRALNGTNDSGAAPDAVYDGVNWRYLQEAKPITFKYANIPDGQGISNVSFQIFFDDLQSGDATNSSSNVFSQNSSSYFRVYLSQKNGANMVEVPEFAEVLNKYAQSGPKGNMISLNLPESYFNIIKAAAGQGQGLEFLVDDTRLGTSGDSFCIDFAKMTVNAPASRGSANAITVKGKVVDVNSNPIANVKVTSGDGQSALTDSTGAYTINNVAPGILSLTFSNYKYNDDIYVYGNATSGSTVDLTSTPEVLVLGVKSSITAAEKYKVQFTIQKCDSNGNPISGQQPIVLDSKNLTTTGDYVLDNGNGTGTSVLHATALTQIQPGFRYKLTYTLTLKSYSDIGDVLPFTLTFSSRIKAKITQENNPAWGSDGSESAYTTGFTEYSGSTSYASNGSYSNPNYTEVYFEKPSTSSYWTTSAPILTLYSGSASSYTQYSSTTMTNDTNNSGWYKYTFGNHSTIASNSLVKIVDGGNSSNTSGVLYYFGTQKVFVCTN